MGVHCIDFIYSFIIYFSEHVHIILSTIPFWSLTPFSNLFSRHVFSLYCSLHQLQFLFPPHSQCSSSCLRRRLRIYCGVVPMELSWMRRTKEPNFAKRTLTRSFSAGQRPSPLSLRDEDPLLLRWIKHMHVVSHTPAHTVSACFWIPRNLKMYFLRRQNTWGSRKNLQMFRCFWKIRSVKTYIKTVNKKKRSRYFPVYLVPHI